MNQELQPVREDVTIGVVGATQVVTRIAEIAREDATIPHRLVTAVYERETDAGERARRIVGEVDVLLFAGPLPYDVATAEGPLPVPATYLPTGGSALPTALLKGSLAGTFDVRRVSIDSASERDVAETYADLGIDRSEVQVMPYQESVKSGAFLDFHTELYAAGRTTGAITTVPSVADALTAAGVPHQRMTHAPITLRNALRTARLLGSGARLEDSRIAVLIVRLPASALPVQTSPSNYWYQELKLTLHRSLLADARRMNAAVLERDEHSYLVITTMGSLRAGTDDLTRAPFLAATQAGLGITAEVGIGYGRTTLEADENAQRAVGLAAESADDLAYLVGPAGSPVALPAAAGGATPRVEPVADRQSELLADIVGLLAAEHDDSRIVDADRIAQLQGVTLRTARRTLRALVDAGLAWPMPPAKLQKVGRPPVRYQLLDERLH